MWFRYVLSVAALVSLEESLWCCGEKYYHLSQGSCDPGQFECDGTRCLGMKSVCDTKNDCQDKKDEKGCICYSFDMFSCGEEGRCVKEEDFCRGDNEGCAELKEVIDCRKWPTTPKPTESSTEITTEATTESTTVMASEICSDNKTETSTEQTTEIIAETTVELDTEPTLENATDTTPGPLEDIVTESIPDTMTMDAAEEKTAVNNTKSISVDAPRGEHYKKSESNEEDSDWKSYAIPGGIIIGLLPVSLIIFLIRRQRASAVYRFSPYENHSQKY